MKVEKCCDVEPKLCLHSVHFYFLKCPVCGKHKLSGRNESVDVAVEVWNEYIESLV